ncbi:F0F1 ATP synthase subunit B' [Roseomonas sp. OT10]|uniref:F0F1 ATP synthase subunit B family protein n=1 Tax=Roseomonas cutis TaxID=2897332 RepID=UPI001E3F6612|nr:F0F1 ATP synthase subunit B' [Roseomonas sp. OT10]UFN51258.1 F0F1 ATP synthase subunit B' [Roseomonas sp. OT10]
MIRRTPSAMFLAAFVLAIAVLAGPAATPALAQRTEQLTPGGPVTPVIPDADRAAAIRAQELSAHDHAVAAAEARDTGGMPQLDFSNPLMISQIVWLLILFGAFVFLCAYFLLPPVAEVLEDRRRRISSDLEAARAAKAEADAAEAAHRDASAKARAEAQAAINAAVQAANAEATGKAEALNARLNEQIAAAESRIAAARDSAMGALREVATDAAGALVERLSGIRDQAAVASAVDRELAARGRA